MLPIVDANWSPSSHENAKGCHILRAVAVQAAMSKTGVDQNLESLVAHAKTPGLCGLPNAIAAFLDIQATDAVDRINEFIAYEKVLGVSTVLDDAFGKNAKLIAPCVDLLASNQASIDVCGEMSYIPALLNMEQCSPTMSIVCNISQCSVAGKQLSVNDWPEVVSALASYENLTIKITQTPLCEFQAAVDQLTLVLLQLTDLVGVSRILFGSSGRA